MENKLGIANQFMSSRPDMIQMGRDLLEQTDRNPSLAKDAGIKREILKTSLTTYRAMMYALGTPVSSIDSNVKAIREERNTRNGVIEFAKNVFSSWDSVNSPTHALTQGVEYDLLEQESNHVSSTAS